MVKFRQILENKIKQANEAVKDETPLTEPITEKEILDKDPIEQLRLKGFVLKTNVPTKTGRELNFFKNDQAEEAYEYLINSGYDKKFKIGHAGKVISISIQR